STAHIEPTGLKYSLRDFDRQVDLIKVEYTRLNFAVAGFIPEGRKLLQHTRQAWFLGPDVSVPCDQTHDCAMPRPDRDRSAGVDAHAILRHRPACSSDAPRGAQPRAGREPMISARSSRLN